MFFRIGAVLRILLLDVIFLALLIGGLVALWGFRATDVREDVPATVRVYKGQVAIVDTATGQEERGGGVRTLKVGQRLQVESGSDSFVFFADGSVSRLTGPAELGLTTSRRVIKKPPILSGLRPSSSPGVSTLTVRAQLLSGDVVTKTPSGKNLAFGLESPGVLVLPQGAAGYALRTPPGGQAVVEVGEGSVAVGIVADQGGSKVPVVVPALTAGQGIAVTASPPRVADSSEVTDLLREEESALPRFAPGVSSVKTDSFDFEALDQEGIRAFVGVRVNGVTVTLAKAFERADPAALQDAIDMPWLGTTSITDAAVADTLADVSGGPTVHLLSGNIAQIEYKGTTFVVSLSAADGRVIIQGLPFAIDPPVIEDAVKKALGVSDLPAVLSVATRDGEASVAYLQGSSAASPGGVPGEAAPVPDSLPHTAPFFERIPTPREISTDWKIVGSNALIAAIVTFLASTLAGFAGDFVGEHEEWLRRVYRPLGWLAEGIRKRGGMPGTIGRWLRPGPLTRGVWLMFVFGAIYSFLAVGAGLFGPSGLTLLLTLSFTTGFLALYDPWVRAFFARRIKVQAKVGLLPGQAGVALATVGVSRAFAFQPGLMLGSLGGLKMDKTALTEQQKFTLNLWSIIFLFLLGGLAWSLVFLLSELSVQSWAQGFFKVARGFVSGLQDWSLVVFAVAVQRVFFTLLPVPKSTGKEMMKRNVLAWSLAFGVIAFIFLHTQLNKQKPLLDLTPKMYWTLLAALLLAAIAYGYRWRKKRAAKSKA